MNDVILQLLPEEQKKLADKWRSTGMLRGCDSWEEAQLGSILENQLLLNKALEGRWPAPIWDLLKRLTLPILRRCFDPEFFIPNEMVSIQCMAAPQGMAYYLDRYGTFKNTSMTAKTKVLKTKFPLFIHLHEGGQDDDIRPWWPSGEHNLYLSNTYPDLFQYNSATMLDNEMALILEIGRAMQQEIIREIISDLRSITEFHLTHVWKSPAKLSDFIRLASSEMGKEVGGEATWLVTSPSLGSELATMPDFNPKSVDGTFIRFDKDVHEIGTLGNKWLVYVNPTGPENEILLGKRGRDNPLDAGYFYGPYCPITFQAATMKKLGPDSQPLNHLDDTSIICRYSKKATNIKYYSVISIIGYSPKPIEDIPHNIKLPEGTGRQIVVDDNNDVLDDVPLETEGEVREVSRSELSFEEITELNKIKKTLNQQ